MTYATIRLPKSIVRRMREEAEKLGMSLEEYVLELVAQGLDPKDRAREYIEAARDLLSQAREELKSGNARQAAEKLWGATALAVKAYASWRHNKVLRSHAELWAYKRKMMKEFGEWVNSSWNGGQSMHVCFYEGWCTEEDVESTLKDIKRLVDEVARRIKEG